MSLEQNNLVLNSSPSSNFIFYYFRTKSLILVKASFCPRCSNLYKQIFIRDRKKFSQLSVVCHSYTHHSLVTRGHLSSHI